MKLRTTVAAAALSAVLLWASAPPVGLGWLAWFALVPAAAASLRFAETRAGRLAVPLSYGLYLELLLVPALPFGLARNQWGDPVVPVMVGDSPVLVVAVVVVPLFALALYALRFPQPVRLERAPTRLAATGLVLVPATAWTALDLVRTKFDPAGLWGPLYLSQHETTPALSALAGPWVVTFTVVAVNWALALVLVRRETVRVAASPAALALGVVALAVATGPESSERGRITVAAVQPGYDTAEFGRPVLHYLRRAHRNLERASLDLVDDLAPLTHEAAERGAQVAVWPEATVWVDPRTTSSVGDELGAIARETGLALVVPYFLRSDKHGAAVVVLPDGTMTRPQPKQRPMWFLGESGANRVAAEPVRAGEVRLGALLGVDNQDPAWPRVLARRGATLIVSSTHDWAALAEQQRAASTMHAAALGVPLVRVDWRYGSAVYDAGGRKVADAGLAKRAAVLVAAVDADVAATPYSRVGDAFGWACLAALVPLSLVVRRRASLTPQASAG